MRNKSILTSDDTRQMLSAARAQAESNQWTVSIAVVDDGGHLLALERMDDASPHSAEIAIHKARTAAIMRLSTKVCEELVKERPGLATLPGVVRVQGGLPIKRGVDCLGGVGVAGAASPQDEQVAAAAIAALAIEPG